MVTSTRSSTPRFAGAANRLTDLNAGPANTPWLGDGVRSHVGLPPNVRTVALPGPYPTSPYKGDRSPLTATPVAPTVTLPVLAGAREALIRDCISVTGTAQVPGRGELLVRPTRASRFRSRGAR